MSEELEIFIFFLIWLFSAYFGSFSSWWVSVIGVWLMTAFGMSPQLASITYKLGKIGDVLGGLYLFHKSGNIPTRFLWIGGVVSVFGSFLGTYLIFSLPDWLIYGVSWLSMILLTCVAIIKKSGIHTDVRVSKRREKFYYVNLFLLNIFGNMFIAGSGVWYYNNFEKTPRLLRLGMNHAVAFRTNNHRKYTLPRVYFWLWERKDMRILWNIYEKTWILDWCTHQTSSEIPYRIHS